MLASYSWPLSMVSTQVRTSTMALFYGLNLFRALSPPHVTEKSPVHVFLTLIVHRSIENLTILVMHNTLIASIATFLTTAIIISNSSKFSFIGSIPEAMFRDVPPSSKLLEGYRKLTPSGPRELTDEMQAILTDAVEPKKMGGKNFPIRERRSPLTRKGLLQL